MAKAKVAGSFEEAMTKLEAITRELESGKMPLARAVESYKEGVALKDFAMQQLNNARVNLTIVGEIDPVENLRENAISSLTDLFDILAECRKKSEIDKGCTAIDGYCENLKDLFRKADK